MTAPSAPRIRVRTDGVVIRVLWQAVTDATDYKLYAGDTAAPSGLEADIPDDDMGDDGWFQYSFEDGGIVYVSLTALNVGAEESSRSNEVRLDLHGP